MLTEKQIDAYLKLIKYPRIDRSLISPAGLAKLFEKHLAAIPISSINLHISRGYRRQPTELNNPDALFKKLVEHKKPAVGFESTALLYWVLKSLEYPLEIGMHTIDLHLNQFSKHTGIMTVRVPVLKCKIYGTTLHYLDPSLQPFVAPQSQGSANEALGTGTFQTAWPDALNTSHQQLVSSFRSPFMNNLFIFYTNNKHFKYLTSSHYSLAAATHHATNNNNSTTNTAISNKAAFLQVLSAEFHCQLPNDVEFLANRKFFPEDKLVDRSLLVSFRQQQLKIKDASGGKKFYPVIYQPHATQNDASSLEQTISNLTINRQTTLWVSISGPAGVGKSTLAKTLKEKLASNGIKTTILGLDGFNNTEERKRQLEQNNLTWHYTQLNYTRLSTTLAKLKQGDPCEYPIIDQLTKQCTVSSIDPKEFQVILFEGIYTATTAQPVDYLKYSDYAIVMLPEDKSNLPKWKWEREQQKPASERRSQTQFDKHIADLKEDYYDHVKGASHHASALVTVGTNHELSVRYLNEPVKKKITLQMQ